LESTFAIRPHRHSLTGCEGSGPAGPELASESDRQSYALTGQVRVHATSANAITGKLAAKLLDKKGSPVETKVDPSMSGLRIGALWMGNSPMMLPLSMCVKGIIINIFLLADLSHRNPIVTGKPTGRSGMMVLGKNSDHTFSVAERFDNCALVLH
jgi:hypothetical protein